MKRSADHRIDGICRLYKIERENAYRQGKFILESYQDLTWKTTRDAQYVKEDLISYCSSDLDQAMVYLLEFASDERRDYFESRIDALFSSHMMASMIDSAVSWVREFPGEGHLYYDILCQSYLYRGDMKETEILEILGIERSTFYKRKKEAVTLFGAAMHEVIRKQKEMLDTNRKEAEKHPKAAVGELPFLSPSSRT